MTCPKPLNLRRCEPVRRVARPQLPAAVQAPALDAAADQQSTRVEVSGGEGHDSWVGRRRVGRDVLDVRACADTKTKKSIIFSLKIDFAFLPNRHLTCACRLRTRTFNTYQNISVPAETPFLVKHLLPCISSPEPIAWSSVGKWKAAPLTGNRATFEGITSLSTQPTRQGPSSRFISYRKGTSPIHPIRGGGSGLQS